MPRILAFAGSTRTGSVNVSLVRAIARAARAAGAEVTEIDLRDFAMPIYDGDTEASSGLPEHARRLKALMSAHDAWLISTPEYNSSLPALLKNLIDWTSRVHLPDERPTQVYRGAKAMVVSASPSPRGGGKSHAHLVSILEAVGTAVLPERLNLAAAHEAFGPDGEPLADSLKSTIAGLGQALAAVEIRTAAVGP